MNDFVNPKKRDVQLPKGAKDLADVLQARHRRRLRKGKCEYCGAPAFVVSTCYAVPGILDEEIHRWCEQCRRDLAEFASRPENQLRDVADGAAQGQVTQQIAERRGRERKFMRKRVRERTE